MVSPDADCEAERPRPCSLGEVPVPYEFRYHGNRGMVGPDATCESERPRPGSFGKVPAERVSRESSYHGNQGIVDPVFESTPKLWHPRVEGVPVQQLQCYMTMLKEPQGLM